MLLILDQFGIYIFSLNFSLYGILGVIRSSYYNLESETISNFQNPITKFMIILATGGLSYYLQTTKHAHIFTPIIHTLLLYFTTVIITNKLKIQNPNILQKLGKHSFIIYIGHILILKLLSYILDRQQTIITTGLITIIIIGLSIFYTQPSTQKFIQRTIRR